MIDVEEQLLREISDPEMTRKDVAQSYAFAIRQIDQVDIGRVNRAILDRWSMSALEFIKTEAWKLVS